MPLPEIPSDGAMHQMQYENDRDSLEGLAGIAPDGDDARQVLEIAVKRLEDIPPAEELGEGEARNLSPDGRD